MIIFREGDYVKCIKANTNHPAPGFTQLFVHDEYIIDELSGNKCAIHLEGETGWFPSDNFELVRPEFSEGDIIICITTRSGGAVSSRVFSGDEYTIAQVEGTAIRLECTSGWFPSDNFKLAINKESIPIQVPVSGEQHLRDWQQEQADKVEGLCPGGSYIADTHDYFPFLVRGRGKPDDIIWQVLAPGGASILAEYKDSSIACTVALLLSQGQG